MNRTMTMTEAQPDKKTGKIVTYQAFINDMGSIQTLHADGSTKFYSWQIVENGKFCVRNNLRLRNGANICGYFTSDDSGTYEFWVGKSVEAKDGRVVSARKKEHILTIENLEEGNQL